MQIEAITAISISPAAAAAPIGKSEAVGGVTEKALLPLPYGHTPASNPSKPHDDQADVEKALHALQKAVEPFNISLKFSRDKDTGTMVMQMIDQTTGEMLRQLPDPVSLHLSATLGKLQGQLFDRKA